MPHASRYILTMTLGLMCTAGSVSAQSDQTTDWQPVDQTVSDLDLRATSSRYVEQGIGVYGQTGSLYQRPGNGVGLSGQGQPLSQMYQLRKPGYTVYLDQPEHLVIDRQGALGRNVSPSADGHFISLIPPNAVFDLVHHAQTPVPLYDVWYDSSLSNFHMNTRIDGVIDGEVTGESAELLLPPLPIAQHLPPHLVRERELRAAEARQAAESAEDESTETQDGAGTDTSEH